MRTLLLASSMLVILSLPALAQQSTTPTPQQDHQQALTSAYSKQIAQQRSQFLEAATSCNARLDVANQDLDISRKKIVDLQKQISDLQKKLATKTNDDSSPRPDKK